MSRCRKFVPFVLLCMLFGCQGGTESPSAPASGGAAGSSSTQDPRAALIAAFRRASEQKDLDAMLALYCWDGVDAEMRETVSGNVRDELRQPVMDLEIVDAEPGKHGPREEGGFRWKPNLPVVAVMKARFAPAAPGTGLSVSEAEYLLGMQGGEYRIVVPVRD